MTFQSIGMGVFWRSVGYGAKFGALYGFTLILLMPLLVLAVSGSLIMSGWAWVGVLISSIMDALLGGVLGAFVGAAIGASLGLVTHIRLVGNRSAIDNTLQMLGVAYSAMATFLLTLAFLSVWTGNLGLFWASPATLIPTSFWLAVLLLAGAFAGHKVMRWAAEQQPQPLDKADNRA